MKTNALAIVAVTQATTSEDHHRVPPDDVRSRLRRPQRHRPHGEGLLNAEAIEPKLHDEERARTQETTPATIADHADHGSRETPNATIQNPNGGHDDDGAEDEQDDPQVAVRTFQIGVQSGLDRGALGRVQQSGARPLANLRGGSNPFFVRIA